MDTNIKIGITYNQTMIVENKDTASAFGSGLIDVFATPAMIAFMENTAYKSIESFLPDGDSTVGIEINVKHIKATLPGSVVACHSEVVNVDGKRIFFNITASDEKGVIGTALHTRYIINKHGFLQKISQ